MPPSRQSSEPLVRNAPNPNVRSCRRECDAADERGRRHAAILECMTAPPYTCPCCGFRTLPGAGNYDLCPVCFWEDDGMHDNDADSVEGPNGITLAEGQRLYQRYGS